VTDFRGENLTGSVFDDVEAELNRRYPDRAKMRPDDADGYREAWAALERLWPQTVARARRLDPDLLHERVDGEYSFIETLRHLVFATDAWSTASTPNETSTRSNPGERPIPREQASPARCSN